jgi:hypothetical protein
MQFCELQPSNMLQDVRGESQVLVGVHEVHWNALQTIEPEQVPHDRVPPHPSGGEPQLSPRLAQVLQALARSGAGSFGSKYAQL